MNNHEFGKLMTDLRRHRSIPPGVDEMSVAKSDHYFELMRNCSDDNIRRAFDRARKCKWFPSEGELFNLAKPDPIDPATERAKNHDASQKRVQAEHKDDDDAVKLSKDAAYNDMGATQRTWVDWAAIWAILFDQHEGWGPIDYRRWAVGLYWAKEARAKLAKWAMPGVGENEKEG